MSRSDPDIVHEQVTGPAMRIAGSVVALAVVVLVCVPVAVSAETVPLRIGVAGDIADGTHLYRARATARWLAGEDVVLTTGDNAYPDGTTWNFAHFYDPTWGAYLDRTRPTPGNHE